MVGCLGKFWKQTFGLKSTKHLYIYLFIYYVFIIQLLSARDFVRL